MPVVRRVECVVHDVINHGERVYTVLLEPAIPVPSFKPGQFLHLALEPYVGDGFWPESRVFSIASSPRDRDRLEITYAVKGSFTSRMERDLCPGRTVWVKLPYGEFVIDDDRDAVLFAGGTGVTAFVAFIQSLTPDRRPRVQLYYGARTQDLFVYGSLATARADAVPALTSRFVCEETEGRLNVDVAWSDIEDLDDPLFYLSGPPAMLQALTAQLRARDVDAARIRTDAWE